MKWLLIALSLWLTDACALAPPAAPALHAAGDVDMAIVQSGGAFIGNNANPSYTFPSGAATLGNRLVVAISARTIYDNPLVPSGYEPISDESISLEFDDGSDTLVGGVYTKISNGTETVVGLTGLSSFSDTTIAMAELSGEIDIVSIARDLTNINGSVQSQNTGSATATGAGQALVVFAATPGGYFTDLVVDNSFSIVSGPFLSFNNFNPDAAIASAPIAGSGSVTANFTTTDVGSKAVGFVVFLGSASTVKSVTESATAVDTTLPSAVLPVTDQALTSESFALSVGLTASDAAVANDDPPIMSALQQIAEVALAVDQIAGMAALITVTLSVGAADHAALSASVIASDAATGDDVVQAGAAYQVADSALAVDQTAHGASLSITDNVTITEATGVSVRVFVSDLADPSELVSLLTQALKLVSEVALGTDNAGVIVNVQAIDVALAADSPSVTVQLPVVDLAQAIESITLYTQAIKLVSDAASALDVTTTSAVVAAYDVAYAQDAPILQVVLQVADIGAVIDEAAKFEQLIKSVQDLAFATDGLSITVQVASDDGASAMDSASIAALLSALDQAMASDVVIRYIPGTTKVAAISFSLKQRGIRSAMRTNGITFKLH